MKIMFKFDHTIAYAMRPYLFITSRMYEIHRKLKSGPNSNGGLSLEFHSNINNKISL